MILPPEPEESDPKAISIRFRCPNGEMKMRRFSRDESVEMLIIYAESIGFERTHFRLWNSDRPKKEVFLKFDSFEKETSFTLEVFDFIGPFGQ